MNPATGFGSATNVTLRVKDIPVFYTPYIHFPIDDRRQSGFLAPSIGSSSDNGFRCRRPITQLGAEFRRHVVSASDDRPRPADGRRVPLPDAQQRGASRRRLPDDSNDDRKLQSEYEDQRWMYSWQNRTGLDSRWLAEVDYTDISDPYYFQDLDTNLSISLTLTSAARLPIAATPTRRASTCTPMNARPSPTSRRMSDCRS